MGHLSPEQLVDLAEGTKTEASMPHLQACGVCQQRLSHLRTTMSEAAEADVPEPSPLFWDHLATRVREAVESERAATAAVPRWSWLSARPVWAGALALVVFAVAFFARIDRSRPVPASGPLAVSVQSPSADFGGSDDPSLSLVGDLAAELDWDGARDAGLTSHLGVDNDALIQLTDAERRELRELLKGELARPGA